MTGRAWAVVALGCSLVLSACAGTTTPTSQTSSAPTPQHTVSGAALDAVTFPLTGLRAPNAAAAHRPSLAVKIDNVDGAWPQAGLNQADIVFDILVEGGLTRLMAVYQSHGAPLVGPIRSARPVDARLLRLFHGGYFAYSGASSAEIRPVMRFSHAAMVQDTHDPGLFFRRNDHLSPDNLFSSTDRLLRALHRQAPHKAAPPQVFHYATTKPKGTPTSGVVVPFPAATAGWTWAGRHWVRTQDGHPDRLTDGSRVSATNVVIMSVKVVGTGIFEANGAEDPLPVTIGSGKTWVLSRGVRVAGTWTRPTIAAPLRLTDSVGHPIALTPGRTWVELMPDSGSPTFHR